MKSRLNKSLNRNESVLEYLSTNNLLLLLLLNILILFSLYISWMPFLIYFRPIGILGIFNMCFNLLLFLTRSLTQLSDIYICFLQPLLGLPLAHIVIYIYVFINI